MTETPLNTDYSRNPEPAGDRESHALALRRTRRRKTTLVAINVFFGILLGTWPFVTFFGVLAWDQPLQSGFHRWLLDYVTWTTVFYPLVYFAALGFSIFAYRRRHPRRALVIAALPVLTAYPWVLVLSLFISVFPFA